MPPKKMIGGHSQNRWVTTTEEGCSIKYKHLAEGTALPLQINGCQLLHQTSVPSNYKHHLSYPALYLFNELRVAHRNGKSSKIKSI